MLNWSIFPSTFKEFPSPTKTLNVLLGCTSNSKNCAILGYIKLSSLPPSNKILTDYPLIIPVNLIVAEAASLFIALRDNFGLLSACFSVSSGSNSTKNSVVSSFVESEVSSSHYRSNNLLFWHLWLGLYFSSQLKHSPLAFLNCISLKLILFVGYVELWGAGVTAWMFCVVLVLGKALTGCIGIF